MGKVVSKERVYVDGFVTSRAPRARPCNDQSREKAAITKAKRATIKHECLYAKSIQHSLLQRRPALKLSCVFHNSGADVSARVCIGGIIKTTKIKHQKENVFSFNKKHCAENWR